MKTSKENLDDCTCVAPKGEFKASKENHNPQVKLDESQAPKILENGIPSKVLGDVSGSADNTHKTHIEENKKMCSTWYEEGFKDGTKEYEKKINDAFEKLKALSPYMDYVDMNEKTFLDVINKIREEMK